MSKIAMIGTHFDTMGGVSSVVGSGVASVSDAVGSASTGTSGVGATGSAGAKPGRGPIAEMR